MAPEDSLNSGSSGMTEEPATRPEASVESKHARQRPRGAVDRVAQVHRQARPTLLLAGMFAIAAPISAAVPHRTGVWLPLHLFLVGALLGAVMAATQLLSVTWSASPAPAFWLANAQRLSLFGGALGVVAGREFKIAALVGISGVCVIASLVLLIVSLLQIRASAVTDRYRPAILGYCIGAGFGIVGSALGTAIASGGLVDSHARIRSIHLTANALGLVGLVIASTLPYFVATQARMKMSGRAAPKRIQSVILVLSASAIVAIAGWAADSTVVVVIGIWVHAAGIAALTTLMPRIGKKQLAWAGPRLVQLGVGFCWWVAAVVLLGANELFEKSLQMTALKILVIGGYAQILFASLAYFAPVILAGKRKPGDGLRITKSWIALFAANLATVGALVNSNAVLALGVLIWLLEASRKGIQLGRFARRQVIAAT